jgi:ribonuclease HII
VVLPLSRGDLRVILRGVRDSKQLSAARRESLVPEIVGTAESVALGWASAAEVDSLGIVRATRNAMIRSVERLDGAVNALLIDYIELPGYSLPQRALPKADARCLSVAAASVVAKVARDRLMVQLDLRYPGYGFAAHKGYGTPQHRAALAKLGPTPIHRMSWQPLRGIAQT